MNIIEMAREAGFHIEKWSYGESVSVYESGKTIDITNELKEFAVLVAAHEREACAKVCEQDMLGDNSRRDYERMNCAAAIRARGASELS